MQRRREKPACRSPQAMPGQRLLLSYAASLTLLHNISLVLEEMQLESKSSGTEGEQWHGLSAPGEQMLTCPARPWETFPPKEGAEELRCLLFFHLGSPRSPLLQQRTHERKAKGGRGGASPPHFEVEGGEANSSLLEG